MRVMFVDDDASALASLETKLAALRPRWQMSFVQGASAAVDHLSEQLVDVVVADSKLELMSGVALLARVRGTQPQAMRIIVSTEADVESMFREQVLSVVHQVLPKPCDPALLETTIERSMSLQALFTSSAVKSAITSIRGLPTIPPLFSALSSMIDDPRVGIDSITTLIEGEPSITARVLQVVNSAFFARGHGITTVRQAITVLGVDVLRVLVLTTEMFAMFEHGRTSTSFSLVDLATRSLQAARAAEKLAEADDALREHAGAAFSAAVLRDVGQIVMATALPDLYDSAHFYANAKNIPLHHAERLLLKFTHAELGAYLLALWGLPSVLVEAVAYHHFPQEAPIASRPVAQLIHDAG